jgi:hypothetical protein
MSGSSDRPKLHRPAGRSVSMQPADNSCVAMQRDPENQVLIAIAMPEHQSWRRRGKGDGLPRGALDLKGTEVLVSNPLLHLEYTSSTPTHANDGELSRM